MLLFSGLTVLIIVELRLLGESDSLTKTKHSVNVIFIQNVNSAQCFECQCEVAHISAG